jgi:hypothetical protein
VLQGGRANVSRCTRAHGKATTEHTEHAEQFALEIGVLRELCGCSLSGAHVQDWLRRATASRTCHHAATRSRKATTENTENAEQFDLQLCALCELCGCFLSGAHVQDRLRRARAHQSSPTIGSMIASSCATAIAFSSMIGPVRKCRRAVWRKRSRSEMNQRSLTGHSS